MPAAAITFKDVTNSNLKMLYFYLRIVLKKEKLWVETTAVPFFNTLSQLRSLRQFNLVIIMEEIGDIDYNNSLAKLQPLPIFTHCNKELVFHIHCKGHLCKVDAWNSEWQVYFPQARSIVNKESDLPPMDYTRCNYASTEISQRKLQKLQQLSDIWTLLPTDYTDIVAYLN